MDSRPVHDADPRCAGIKPAATSARQNVHPLKASTFGNARSRGLYARASRLTSRRTFLQALLAGIAVPRTVPEPAIAETTTGKVRGIVDNGIVVFKGIRYGADTSTRRFMPP